MMNKIIAILALTLFASCSPESKALLGAARGGNKAEAPKPENITRQIVIDSDLALIRVYFGANDPYGKFYPAFADNNGTVTFGKSYRSYFTMRGGLVVTSHAIGNDLLDVIPNRDDPIQYQRPLSSWPKSIDRRYRLPGDGLDGEIVEVNCTYTRLDSGVIEVLDVNHSTVLMSEDCLGDKFSFENRYFVGSNGFIWKSEQWVGNNPVQLIVEIVEPLD